MTMLAGLLLAERDASAAAGVSRMAASLAGAVAPDLRAHGRFALTMGSRSCDRQDSGDGIVAGLAGRLHNRRELADALGVSACAFRDESLVGLAYRRWDTGAIAKMRGHFALVLWDADRERLILARDPIGLVPLYYEESRGSLAFATSLRTIAARPGFERMLNEPHFAAHLLFRQPDPHATFFAGVKRLPPGHLLTSTAGRVSVERHYAPRPAPLGSAAAPGDYAAALRDRLERAVRAAIPPDRRVGVYVSGGLDSSALTCLALRDVRDSGGVVVAASSVLPVDHQGPEVDDTPYLAALEASEPDLRVERVTGPRAGVFEDLEDGFARLGRPVNAYHYMDRALAGAVLRGRTAVVLSGLGGDSGASLRVPGGARRGPLWRRISRRLSRLRRAAPSTPAARAFASRYRGLPVRRVPDDATALQIARLSTGIGPVTEELIELHRSMGLELALPFFDLDLMEFLAAVPAAQFSHGGQDRSLLRRAMSGVLPERIRLRTDKQPYVPDFPRRVAGEAPLLAAWLAGKRGALSAYLDAGAIARSLGSARPSAGWDSWDRSLLSVGASGLVAARFLVWFDSHRGGDA
jgi:asparagine synthase (glutamine-hydrolysing)